MSNLKDKPYLFQKGNKAAEKWTEERAFNFGLKMQIGRASCRERV